MIFVSLAFIACQSQTLIIAFLRSIISFIKKGDVVTNLIAKALVDRIIPGDAYTR